MQGTSELQSQESLTKHFEVTEQIRVAAKFASGKAAEKSISQSTRKRPPSVYNPGDEVLVRPQGKKRKVIGKSISAPVVEKGKVVACNLSKCRYHVQLTNGNTAWYSVENMTSMTVEEEKGKKKFDSGD